MSRDPKVLARAIHYDQHHGVAVPIAMEGLKGLPVDETYITCAEALEMAERLVRSAKQHVEREAR